MKALRFAWDHPGLTAMLAFAAALLGAAAVQAPWLFAVYAVAALSFRKGSQDAAKRAECERRAADERLRVQREIWEAHKAANSPCAAVELR